MAAGAEVDPRGAFVRVLSHLMAMQRAAELGLMRFARAAAADDPDAARPWLRPLELRCKVEEQVTLPMLREAAAAPEIVPAIEALECDIASMRDAASQLQSAEGGRRAALLGALRELSRGHFRRVAQVIDAVGLHGGADWERVSREIGALRRRWRQEVATTGDIEDEELDPVGLPPR